MARARGWPACLGLAAATAAASASAPAAAAAICPGEGPRHVELVVAGDARALETVRDGISDALGGIGLRVDARRAEHIDPRDVSRTAHCEPALVARLLVDLEADSRMILYLTDGAGTRVFVRRFPLEHGLDLVALESLELVAQGSLETLLAGQELGVEREEYDRSLTPPPPAPRRVSDRAPPPHPRPAERQLQLGTVAFYEAALLGSGVVQHGPGLGLELESTFGRLGLALHARLPVRFESPSLSGRLLPEGVRVFYAKPMALSTSTLASAGVAAGADVTQVSADARQSDAHPASPFWVVDPLLRGFASVEQRAGSFRISALLGAELALTRARYVLARADDQQQSLFVPWRVRPLCALLVGAEL